MHPIKPHPIALLIAQADAAINREDFAALAEFYSDDAVLVVKPGMNVIGRDQIKKAFGAIAEHFQHSLQVRQAGMEILETGETALVLARTVISAAGMPDIERKATYVFAKSSRGDWHCVIDNSYGHELLAG